MSFVTTARSIFGQSSLLSRSTRAVFPLPTGPAMPTRNARDSVVRDIAPPCSEQKIPLREWQLGGRLARQQLAVRSDLVGFRVDLDVRCRGVANHVALANRPALADGDERLCQSEPLADAR